MTTLAERPSTRARRRVFLVDDHPLVREWLANVINQQTDLTVCGHAEGREGCIEAIEKKHPDVVVVDISLKDCSGFDLITEIKQRAPKVEVIVLSMHESPLYAKRALRAGATGYVVKRETTRKICGAIRDVLNGKQYVSEDLTPPEDSEAPPRVDVDLTLLSDRELEIFRFLGLGNSTRQISDTLGISIKTVQVHCGNIREKLGIHGATELLSAAVRWHERHAAEGE
jgi:DNA-binding NarL/FixJ family response regulator